MEYGKRVGTNEILKQNEKQSIKLKKPKYKIY